LVLAVIEGRELKMSGSHASTLHMEPAHFSRAVEKLTGEFQAQAKSALGLDDAGFAAFTEHVWQHHPNEIREAIMAQVDNGNMQPLRALGQKFAATGQQWDDDSLLDAEVPSGARVWRDSITGKV